MLQAQTAAFWVGLCEKSGPFSAGLSPPAPSCFSSRLGRASANHPQLLLVNVRGDEALIPRNKHSNLAASPVLDPELCKKAVSPCGISGAEQQLQGWGDEQVWHRGREERARSRAQPHRAQLWQGLLNTGLLPLLTPLLLLPSPALVPSC